jgi:hypothetical protein
MAARESVRQHLQREAELEGQLDAQAAELATLRKEIVWNSVVNVSCPYCWKCVTVNIHDELRS